MKKGNTHPYKCGHDFEFQVYICVELYYIYKSEKKSRSGAYLLLLDCLTVCANFATLCKFLKGALFKGARQKVTRIRLHKFFHKGLLFKMRNA